MNPEDETLNLEQLEERLEMESAGTLADPILPIECWCNKND